MCSTSSYGLRSCDLRGGTHLRESGRGHAEEEAVRDFVTHHLSPPDPYL